MNRIVLDIIRAKSMRDAQRIVWDLEVFVKVNINQLVENYNYQNTNCKSIA